jgi:hypothetical protein
MLAAMDDTPRPTLPPLTPEEEARLRAELERELEEGERENAQGEMMDGPAFLAEMKKWIDEFRAAEKAAKNLKAK